MTTTCSTYSRVACLLLLLVSMPLLYPVQAECASPGEHQIKAAMLFNMIRFIDWPESALPETTDKISICIATRGALGAAVESLRGKQVKGKIVTVRQTPRSNDMSACHVIVFSDSDRRTTASILDSTRSTVALTVGDAPGFALSGGVVGFNMQESRVRFEINQAAAQRHRLRISSQLLKLAHIVQEEP